MRFRLLSMMSGVVVAGILLGVNLMPRVIPGPRLISLDSVELPRIDLFESWGATVFVVQGWPFFLHEEEATVRKIPRGATPAQWVWSPYFPFNWASCVANALIALVLIVGAMVGVEWILRRRDAVRGAT